jgi:hypothetical protein
MKMYLHIIFLKISAIVIAGLLLGACTGDFSEINGSGTPTREEVRGDFYYVGVHFQSLQQNVIPAENHAYQYDENLTGQPYARYLTITKSAWNIENFGVFNASIDWLNSTFNSQIVGIYVPWFELQKTLSAEDKLNHYSWAWAELLRVAAVHRHTDMYGPLPYSEIKKNTGTMYVAYDTQEAIYAGLFEDLNNVITILTEYVQSGGATSSLKEYDLVYGGDFTKWLKFANSLKLRMAMRIAYVDPVNARKYALEAIDHPIGVITANADNAWLHFDPNPLYIMQGPYGDTRACAEIMTYLQGYEDPRITAYFAPVADGDYKGEYRALRLGIESKSEDWAQSNFSVPKVNSQDPLLWMCAAEVAFLKAEAALHGWTGGDVEALYEQGVMLSFEQWGVSGLANYLTNNTRKQAAYSDDTRYSASPVSNITVKWNNAANVEEKLERIITQKWLALYPLGHEAWAEYRRTGYPRFFPVPVIHNTDQTLKSHGASRIPYGPQEALDNTKNYNDAVANKGLRGNDGYGVRLWWDAKNPKAGW